LSSYGPPPAAKKVLKELPTLTCDSFKESLEECSVCQEKLSEQPEKEGNSLKEEEPSQTNKNQMIIKMPCAHNFHFPCLIQWLNAHNSCPTCRFELPTDDQDYENLKRD